EENALYAKKPNLCIFLLWHLYHCRLKQKLACQAPVHDRATIYYALGRRPWSAAAGAPCSTPLRQVTTNVRGEAETTRTVRRAQGKIGQAMELAGSSSACQCTPHGGDIMSFFLSPKASRARLREAENARKNRAEIVQALSQRQVTRRELVQWGLLTVGSLWAPIHGLSPFAKSAYADSNIPTGAP